MCPDCWFENPRTYNFCGACGAPTEGLTEPRAARVIPEVAGSFEIEPGWGDGGSLIADRRSGFTVGIALAVEPIDVSGDGPYSLGLRVSPVPPSRSRPAVDLELRFAAARPRSRPRPDEMVAATVEQLAGADRPAEIEMASADRCVTWGADAACSVMSVDDAADVTEELHVLARADLDVCVVVSKRVAAARLMPPEHFNHFQAWLNASMFWDPRRRWRPRPRSFAPSHFLAPGPYLLLRPERLAELDGLANLVAACLSDGDLPALREALWGLTTPVLDPPFVAQYAAPITAAFAAAAPTPLVTRFVDQLAWVDNMRDFAGLQYLWLRALARVERRRSGL